MIDCRDLRLHRPSLNIEAFFGNINEDGGRQADDSEFKRQGVRPRKKKLRRFCIFFKTTRFVAANDYTEIHLTRALRPLRENDDQKFQNRGIEVFFCFTADKNQLGFAKIRPKIHHHPS